MGRSEFAQYCERLRERGQFELVPLSTLILDRVCEKVLARGAIVAALRGRSLPCTAEDHGMAVLDSIQSPIMGYRPKGSEKVAVVAGIFTYHRLLQQQATSKPIAAVQIFLLDKAPKPDLRELLLLHELSRSLLRECFTHSTATIADYLHAWFDCRAESSLFGSDKWQQLFPQLRTKADLCGWLEISSKTFIPTKQGDKR